MMCKDLIDFNGKYPYSEEVIEYAVGQYMREANMTTHNFATPTLAELEERGYISEAMRKLKHVSREDKARAIILDKISNPPHKNTLRLMKMCVTYRRNRGDFERAEYIIRLLEEIQGIKV